MKYNDQTDQEEDMDQESDLPLALDAMLAVLRCVNDSMHQVAISGYHVIHSFIRLINNSRTSLKLISNLFIVGKFGWIGPFTSSRRFQRLDRRKQKGESVAWVET